MNFKDRIRQRATDDDGSGLLPDPDPDPEGSMVIVRVGVADIEDDGGRLPESFQDEITNVVTDAVAAATQPAPGTAGALPINFDEAVMVQPFPVPVGAQFQAAVVAVLYEGNLIGNEPDIEQEINARTSRVERFDVIPL
jgi:hypothetical protein